MKKTQLRIFTGIYALILGINFVWFISGNSPLDTETPFRIVLGSMVIFLLPGLVWGEILGFRARHILEMIAISFALTLTIETILLPIPFFLRGSVTLWVSLLFIMSVSGCVILYVSLKKRTKVYFLYPLFNFSKQSLPLRISTLLIFFILIVISYGTYQWGTDPLVNLGEGLLHLSYIRNYFASQHLILHDLGSAKGIPLPNLVNLWEYLIASWSCLINTDPVILYFRGRFVIPLLGLSAMYFFIRAIFSNKIKTEVLFWGVLIMCLGWFMTLSPCSFDWVKQDPHGGTHRVIFNFMASIMHSDSAPDILISLNAGVILLTFRRAHWRTIFLLYGTLIATWLWHPREFFQSALYTGMLWIALLILPYKIWKASLKKGAFIMTIFITIALLFAVCVITIIPAKSHGHNELEMKVNALKYAFSIKHIAGIDNFFSFPNTWIPYKDKEINPRKNQYHLWLILSALSIPFISLYGTKKDKILIMFFILLWFSLVWSFSTLIIIALTYSEFIMNSARIIYIFSYIIIADALLLLSQWLSRFLYLSGVCSLGLFLHLWWMRELPYMNIVSVFLSIVIVISFICLLVSNRLPIRKFTSNNCRINNMLIPILGLLLFFLPILRVPLFGRKTFQLTKDSMRELRREDLSEGILENLKLLKWQEFANKENFLKALEMQIGKEETARYQEQILKHAVGEYHPSVIVDLLIYKADAPRWFTDKNPFGFSKKLIDFLRTVPQNKVFLVHPLGNDAINVYAAQYLAIYPHGLFRTIIRDHPIWAQFQEGKHPLNLFYNDDITNKESIDWLEKNTVDYILIREGKFLQQGLPFHRYPRLFKIVFNNEEKGELLVQYISQSQN